MKSVEVTLCAMTAKLTKRGSTGIETEGKNKRKIIEAYSFKEPRKTIA